jgi:alpha-ketoglutarate-dependent taurine dioxygenase
MPMTKLRVRDINEGFGTEITGLDTRGDFDDETRRTLRTLFDDRGALVFPQTDLDFAFQDRLCRMLIADDGPGTASQRHPFYVSNKEEGGFAPYGRLMFHADMMWHPNPFQVLSLYAVDVALGSARTLLTSGAYAWETLPSDLRARVEKLEAVHITGQVYSRGGDDLLKPERDREESIVKPVAFRHPRTGKTILYVSQQMTREIVGLSPAESEDLLQTLFAHLYKPGIVYEHAWRNSDLLVFDNVTMQHARSYVDPNGPTRTLRKVVAPIPKMAAQMPRYAKAG